MNDTICAISTSQGVGAIAIIRVSGPDSIEIVNKIFQGKDLTKVDSHTINYGYIVDKEQKIDAGKLKNILATYQDAEDLINIGAYKNGSNKSIDYAIKKIDAVNDFLLQQTHDKFEYDEILQQMESIFAE